jgi:hypothetical protein
VLGFGLRSRLHVYCAPYNGLTVLLACRHTRGHKNGLPTTRELAAEPGMTGALGEVYPAFPATVGIR